jgi:hypothetical protein
MTSAFFLYLFCHVNAPIAIAGVDTTACLFDQSYAVWVRLPDEVGFEPDHPPLDSLDFHKCVQIDLDDDGIPEDLWVNGCGTGGCGYEMHHGGSGEYIGDIFGDPVIVLKQRINGMPVLQTYSHASAGSGDFNCYVFDGKQYVRVSAVLLLGEAVDSLFQRLSGIPWLHYRR